MRFLEAGVAGGEECEESGGPGESVSCLGDKEPGDVDNGLFSSAERVPELPSCEEEPSDERVVVRFFAEGRRIGALPSNASVLMATPFRGSAVRE